VKKGRRHLAGWGRTRQPMRAYSRDALAARHPYSRVVDPLL